MKLTPSVLSRAATAQKSYGLTQEQLARELGVSKTHLLRELKKFKDIRRVTTAESE